MKQTKKNVTPMPMTIVACRSPDTYTTKLKEEPTQSTRGMPRSYSSPDIMKQLADEDKASSTPGYDRTSKPPLRWVCVGGCVCVGWGCV